MITALFLVGLFLIWIGGAMLKLHTLKVWRSVGGLLAISLAWAFMSPAFTWFRCWLAGVAA